MPSAPGPGGQIPHQRPPSPGAALGAAREGTMTDISVTIGPHRLPGTLALHPGDCALVLFAHGSGSGRFSPRNRQVAEALQDRGLATLLFDLLDADEAQDRQRVFDIPLLARRLTEAMDGTLDLSSTVGRGTHVSVTLPCA